MVPIAAEEDVGTCYCKVTRIGESDALDWMSQQLMEEDMDEEVELERYGESDIVHLRMLLFTLEGKDTGALYVQDKIYKIIDLRVS